MPIQLRTVLARRVTLCVAPVLAGLGAALAVLAVVGGTAQAAPASCTPSVLVINANDTGAGSLRQAAQDVCAGGTIVFAAALSNTTVALSSGEISISRSLTIDASGAPGLSVDAQDLSRVFNIGAGSPVTLSALTLERGSGVGYGGAVLAAAGSPLVLVNINILSSTVAAYPGSGGGGLYADSSLTVTGGLFQGNHSSERGGGLYTLYDLVLSGTAIMSNTADWGGGALYAYGAATLTNPLIESNGCSIAYCGGAALVNGAAALNAGQFISNQGGGLQTGSTLAMTGTEFLSNSVNSGYAAGATAGSTAVLNGGLFQGNQGGGLYAFYNLQISGTRFISNTSGGGGAGAAAFGWASVSGALFQGNRVTTVGNTSMGGGLLAQGGMQITATQFLSNSGGAGGGGAAAWYYFGTPPAVVVDSLFQGNQCTASPCDGGGLYAGMLTLTDTQFIGNRSAGGSGGPGQVVLGGGGAAAAGAATLSGGLFTANQAGNSGGGLSAASVILSGTQFISNTGGGVQVSQGAIVTDALFQNNQGGGLTIFSFNGGGGDLVMSDTIFISNTGGAGAGAYVGGIANVFGGLFQGNHSANSSGGGLAGSRGVNVTGTQFLSNTSLLDGGGVYSFGGARLTGVRLAANQSGYSGGGLYVVGALTVTNSSFDANFAQDGGGLFTTDGAAYLANNLFVGNHASHLGEAVYASYPEASQLVHNTIVSDTLGSGAAIAVAGAASGLGVTDTLISQYSFGISRTSGSVYEDFNLYDGVTVSTTGGVTSGGHSLAGSPAFFDAAGGDFHIGVSSAARDAGTDAGVTSDFEGDPRPAGSGFDIGFDELPVPVATADAFNTPPDTPLLAPPPGVLANDSGALQGQLTALLVSGPVTGALDLAADGSFTFTPPLGFGGLVTFTYQASNGLLLSGPATVTILVEQAPVAEAGPSQAKTVVSSVTLDGSSSADPDNNLPLAFGWRQAGGTAVILSSTTISRPVFTAPSAPSVLTFTLVVTDALGLASLPATTTVTVTEQAISGLSAAGGSPTVLGSATPFTASISAGSNVTFAWGFGDGGLASGASVSHTYALPGAFQAVVTATNSVGQVTATTTVTVADLPITGLSAASSSPTVPGSATAFTASISAGSNVTFAWGFGDGGLASGASVSHTYALPGAFQAVVTATNSAGQVTATTTVTVADLPITGLSAASSSPTVLGSATAFTASLSAGTNVTYAWAFGDSAAGNGISLSHSYGLPGLFQAVVTATNSAGQVTATTTVTVNDVPIAASNTYTTSEDTPLHVLSPGVLGNDTDAFPGGLTAQLASGPSLGGLVLAPSGAFTYTPPLNFNGPVTFTYRASDGLLSAAPALVTITVLAVNDPPTISGLRDVTTTVDAAVGPLSFTVGDVETPAGALTLTVESSNTALAPLAGIQFGGSGAARTVTITPAAGMSGTATITVRVSDGLTTTSEAFVLTVLKDRYKLYLPLARR